MAESRARLRRIGVAGLRWFARGAVVALMVAALVVGAVRAWTALAARPEFALSAALISLPADHPVVHGGAMAAELRRELGPVLAGASLFESDLCWRVDRELRASLWVADVRSVRRLVPNKLAVDVVFRTPAGQVSHGGRTWMVDLDGYWLPERLYRRPARWSRPSARALAPPVIVSPLVRNHPPLGRPWHGPALAAGARLYAFLETEGLFGEMEIRTIDVARVGLTDNAGLEPEIVLTTRGGAQVKWGRSDVYRSVRGLEELTPVYPDDRKLEMLRSALRKYPALQGVEYIDVRFRKIVELSRLASSTPEDAGNEAGR